MEKIFDEWGKPHAQNFDKLLHRRNIKRNKKLENFDKSLAIRQIHQTFPPSNFYAIR